MPRSSEIKPLHLDVEQGSEKWHQLRAACITATGVYTILHGSYKAKRSYAIRIRNEQAGVVPQQFETEATLFGRENESAAIAMYEMTRDVDTEPGGMFVAEPHRPWLRASPDALVGEPGLLEVKCRMDVAEHIQCIMDGVPAQHYVQIQVQLIVSDRDWCDYFSYCPDAPSSQVTWSSRVAHPDPSTRAAILDAIDTFWDEWVQAETVPEEPSILNGEIPNFF